MIYYPILFFLASVRREGAPATIKNIEGETRRHDLIYPTPCDRGKKEGGGGSGLRFKKKKVGCTIRLPTPFYPPRTRGERRKGGEKRTCGPLKAAGGKTDVSRPTRGKKKGRSASKIERKRLTPS